MHFHLTLFETNESARKRPTACSPPSNRPCFTASFGRVKYQYITLFVLSMVGLYLPALPLHARKKCKWIFRVSRLPSPSCSFCRALSLSLSEAFTNFPSHRLIYPDNKVLLYRLAVFTDHLHILLIFKTEYAYLFTCLKGNFLLLLPLPLLLLWFPCLLHKLSAPLFRMFCLSRSLLLSIKASIGFVMYVMHANYEKDERKWWSVQLKFYYQ